MIMSQTLVREGFLLNSLSVDYELLMKNNDVR